MVVNFTVDSSNHTNYVFNSTYDYMLCGSPEESIGGSLFIELEDGSCVTAQNPAINLDGYESNISSIIDLPDDILEPIDEWWTDGEALVFMLSRSLFGEPSLSSLCSGLPPVPDLNDEPIFARTSNGTWLIFDPRLEVETNTLSSPISDGGKAMFTASGGEKYCSNAPRTFLNENQCQLSSDACKASSNSQVEILLENSTIAALNNITERYVYAIKGLLVKYNGINLDHPCTPGLRSRWEPRSLSECSPTPLYDITNSSLSGLLSDSLDRNPFIRDIYFPEEGTYCNSSDTEPEIEIEVDGECWKRVHDEHMSIFDVSSW